MPIAEQTPCAAAAGWLSQGRRSSVRFGRAPSLRAVAPNVRRSPSKRLSNNAVNAPPIEACGMAQHRRIVAGDARR
jgi:hypothetical protein